VVHSLGAECRVEEDVPGDGGSRGVGRMRERKGVHVTSRVLRKLSFMLLAWGVASSALADASVIVELKRADGSPVAAAVVLTKGDIKYRCDTDQAGRCTIKGVAGGVYQVSAEQAGKPPGKPKPAMIPPNGEVKLIVNAE
jgi:hypothetical protein